MRFSFSANDDHTCTGDPSVRSHSSDRLSDDPRKTRQVKTARCGGVFSSKLIFTGGIGARRGGTRRISRQLTVDFSSFQRFTNDIEHIFRSLSTSIIIIEYLT